MELKESMQEDPFRICQHKLEFNFRDAICELIEPRNKSVHAPPPVSIRAYPYFNKVKLGLCNWASFSIRAMPTFSINNEYAI